MDIGILKIGNSFDFFFIFKVLYTSASIPTLLWTMLRKQACIGL